ncbi:hypothetical protein VE01_05459 [Pseudogymnoascus verrucosus]|uniref:Uncharacterized protein n=1 Tax=Pseudogymnoascus verrucosus TaxID=342668 RepID=A0A1B8GLX8_9PEZI|nr:uncharacterized protein VE01_05459 [Pseudogymnoascus verrucosus]OBT96842.1 hypothetical protein VE01_05459 [Pseudogymnoascus verrucosus]
MSTPSDSWCWPDQYTTDFAQRVASTGSDYYPADFAHFVARSATSAQNHRLGAYVRYGGEEEWRRQRLSPRREQGGKQLTAADNTEMCAKPPSE